MNLGLSAYLKSHFTSYTSYKYLVATPGNPERGMASIPDPNWVSGFVTGEGNFDVKITKSLTHKLGYRVSLRFRVSQHVRDKALMESLKLYLNSGSVYKYAQTPDFVYICYAFSEVKNQIIPYFYKYPIGGVKAFDF